MSSHRRSQPFSIDFSPEDLESDSTETDFLDNDISEAGDLGLGFGVKPGGLVDDLDAITQCNVFPILNHRIPLSVNSSDTSSGYASNTDSRTSSCRGARTKSSKKSERKAIKCIVSGNVEKIARSTRKFSQLTNEDDDVNSTTSSSLSSFRIADLQNDENEEIDVLKGEIEVYKSLLTSKCDAIGLLRALVTKSNKEKEKIQSEMYNKCEKLKLKINELQFQMGCEETKFKSGEESWKDRYTSLYEQVESLEKDVSSKEEIIKRNSNENAALKREKVELLALLDTKERRKYQRSNSFTSEDSYGPITSGELAVLGACICRGQNMEPCKCALAACAKQKEIQHLQNTIDKRSGKIKELKDISDVYKKAFTDEQKKSSYLMKRNTSLEVILDKTYTSKLKNLDVAEVVDALTEMLCEKNEALVHQQMVTKFLAKKVSTLEKSLEKERK